LAHGLDVAKSPGALEALTTSRPVAVDDADHDVRVARVARERFGLRSCLYVPLVFEDQTLGVLMCSNLTPHAWSSSQQACAQKHAAGVSSVLMHRVSARATPSLVGQGRAKKILDQLPMRVIVLDENLLVVDQNHVEPPAQTSGNTAFSIHDLLQHETHGPVIRAALADLFSQKRSTFEHSFALSSGIWHIHAALLPDNQPPLVVVSVLETTGLVQTQTLMQTHAHHKAMQHMTATVAHEFNNIMQVIVSTLDTINLDLSPDYRARSQALSREAIQRGRQLIRQLTTFTELENQRAPTAFVDMREFIDDMRPLLRHMVGKTHRLLFDVDDTLPQLKVHPKRLKLAVINLVSNARDATERGQNIALVCHHDAKREVLVIGLRDTGCGMDRETLARAQEPFFSTKQVGEGAGIGLSITAGVARQHGGDFVLTSTLNEGTFARLVLPISTDKG